MALIVAPSLFTLYSIHKNGVNVLWWDEWELVPLLQKVHDNMLTFKDLFAQHNEHRLLFPYIFMLAIIELTKLNTIYEMYFSWFLTNLTFIILFKMYQKGKTSTYSSLLLFTPVALIFFTPRQFENIFMGWQIQYYLGILGVVASIYFLNKTDKVDYNFLMAIICGIVASFSVINGLLIWIIGIMVILSRSRNKLLAEWILAGILTYIAFFYDWVRPSYHKIGFDISYFLTNIGSPLSWEKTTALYIGGSVILLSIVVFIYLFKYKFINDNIVPISLMAFSLLSAIMLTFGRSGFGVEQALSSRYISFTLLGVIGIYTIVVNVFKDKKYMCFIIMAMLIIMMVFNYTKGIEEEQSLHNDRVIMADNLLNYKTISDDKLSMYPVADIVRERATFLEENRLNVFIY